MANHFGDFLLNGYVVSLSAHSIHSDWLRKNAREEEKDVSWNSQCWPLVEIDFFRNRCCTQKLRVQFWSVWWFCCWSYDSDDKINVINTIKTISPDISNTQTRLHQWFPRNSARSYSGFEVGAACDVSFDWDVLRTARSVGTNICMFGLVAARRA